MKSINIFFRIVSIFIFFISNAHSSINFTDYSKIPPQEGIDVAGELYNGYRMGQDVARMREEQKQLELQNRILEEQLRLMQKTN